MLERYSVVAKTKSTPGDCRGCRIALRQSLPRYRPSSENQVRNLRRFGGWPKTHRTIDGDFGSFQVASQLDVRNLLGLGDVVKTVQLRIGRKHLLKLQPRRSQQVAHGVFVLDGIEPTPADATALGISLQPCFVQSFRCLPNKTRDVFLCWPFFFFRRHLPGSDPVMNLRPLHKIRWVINIQLHVCQIQTAFCVTRLVTVNTVLLNKRMPNWRHFVSNGRRCKQQDCRDCSSCDC